MIGDEEEIRCWLKCVLTEENIDDFSVQILGNSEKGDGYLGDIIFVRLTSANGRSPKEYNLVLKCSKRSQILREKTPVKDAFINEIYIYNTVLPVFTQFQLEHGINNPFDSVPKCYGKFTSENMEVLVFENLKSVGYTLWNKKQPLTRKHIDMVMTEYSKFHAISFAMKDQQPEKFEELSTGLTDVFKMFMDTMDIESMFGKSFDDLYDVLKGDLDDNTLMTWKNFKNQIKHVFEGMCEQSDTNKVITHGDCWNNNFMYKHAANNETLPVKVAILDWQIAKYFSPICDLSYFLFACISKEDIEDLDEILKVYHKSLTSYLNKMGTDSNVYPLDTFLADWKKYCKYGVTMSSMLFKICATDKDEVVDIAQMAESGQNFEDTFSYEVKDKTSFKNRARHVVKYVVENNLI
jgi:RNAse (barnase) inhibitor barstar